ELEQDPVRAEPQRSAIGELGPRGPKEEEPSLAREGQPIEQPDELRFGPMEVLDPDHDEPVAGERFQIPPPAVSDLVLAFDRIRRQDVRPAEAGAVREHGPDAHPRPEAGQEVARPRRDAVQSDLLEVTRQDLPTWRV